MIAIRTVNGAGVAPYLADVARLRIAVFREFPYLYDGHAGYEEQYLATYSASPESLFVLAFDEERIVGASTGVPLADETEAFQAPARHAGYEPARIFYFGESVLLPEYRGQRLGHRFFDERENYARSLGRFSHTAFCSVLRPADHPRRPAHYRPHDAFWNGRGYARVAIEPARLAWKELDEPAPSEKRLEFWMRPLDAAGER